MTLKRYRWTLAAVSVVMVGFLTVDARSMAGTSDSTQVVVKNFMFTPTSLTVKAGSTVTWTNQDEEPHTVVSIAGVFRSGAMDTDESFSFKFEKPGTYRFVCSIHPRMVGAVVVE